MSSISENLVIHNNGTMENTTHAYTEIIPNHQGVDKLDYFRVNEDQMNMSSEGQTGVGEPSTARSGTSDLGHKREEQELDHNNFAPQEDSLSHKNRNVSSSHENRNAEPALLANNFHNKVDDMVIELPSANGAEEFHLPEDEWLEQDESVAFWVKWRGKWQAGIRCVRADCPLPTLKARPTRDGKKYFVVFFPHTRNYSWADMQLVRPIQECPEPIAHRSHSQGLDNVQDLTIPRRFIMQRLAVGMLNISDKLHNEAVIEAARQISTWKEFAMEASKCENYSDLGRMLLKLHNMILQCYIDPEWIQNSFKTWEQRCQNAPSAESVETLKEELVNSVWWNDIDALWDAPVQPDLGPEWKTWKQDVMKWFSTSHPMVTGRDMDQCDGEDSMSVGLQISRKRPKLEVRRAEMHVLQAEVGSLHETQPPVDSEIDSGFFDRPRTENAKTLMHESCKDKSIAEGTATSDYPGTMVDRWDGILLETANNKLDQTMVVEETAVNPESGGKQLEPGNKFNQCVAFIEAKGRRCIRWANDGDEYCCVHLAIRDKSPKAEIGTPSDTPMCSGTTTHGTKCKHRSQYGSTFCKKHKLQHSECVMDIEKPSIFATNLLKRSHSEMNCSTETVSCQDMAMAGDSRASVYDFSDSAMEGETLDKKEAVVGNSELSIKEHHEVESLHCIGSSHQNDNNPCPDHAKLHTLYCEKHLPAFLKRARNGKSRIISKEIFTEFLRNCSSHKQKLHLHRACVLLYCFVKSAISRRNPVSKETPFQWILSEASKDLSVGECLMKLLSCEREKLKRLWGFDIDNDKPDSPSAIVPVLELESVQRTSNAGMNVKCKICSKEFSNDKMLGPHWMDDHKKEARWLFRGYACAICTNSFTNKKILESHGKETHQVQVLEQCLLLKCLRCGSHFVNAKQLWLHVLSEHSKDFEMSTVAPLLTLPVTETSHQPLEQSNNGSSTKNCTTDVSSRRFICKFCGLKFDILPDLGRHHQAVHMGLNSISHISSQRRTHLNPYKSKSGRLSRPSFSKGLGAASYRIRNRGDIRMKKHFQASASVDAGEERMQIQVTEVAGFGRLVESQCSAVAKSLFSEISKAKPRPSNIDILSVARSTCCKFNLQASLEEQYGVLPERLYLKAAKLCSELNIKVEWHQESFICPKGCTPLTKSHNFYPLIPLPHSFVEQVATKSVEDLVEVEEWQTDECHYIIESHHIESKLSKSAIELCQDLSFGLESVSVNCVVDDDLISSLRTVVDDGSNSNTTVLPMPWDTFTYVKERLVDASLNGDTESSQLGCACPSSTCSPDACDHVYLFDNDYENAKDIYGQSMQGRFPYDKDGRIILEEGYLVYECNSSCSCDKTCPNRVLQNGVQVKLEVFKTKNKGWGVRARAAISRGTFVCEYIGKILSKEEATKGDVRYNKEGCSSYLYKIDAQIDDMSGGLSEGVVSHVIDATRYGNVSRFINHSCSPNLACYQVLVESMDSQLAHIGLYASRNIEAGEEVAYDYHDKQLVSKEQPCYCSMSNCRGQLP